MKIPFRDYELIQIVDDAFARAAEVAGEHLVCKKGCTACCYGAFAISQLDAARLKAAMVEMRARKFLFGEAFRVTAEYLEARLVCETGTFPSSVVFCVQKRCFASVGSRVSCGL